MSHNILQYWEHCDNEDLNILKESDSEQKNYSVRFPKTKGRDKDSECFNIKYVEGSGYKLNTGYFIGVDWVVKKETALYVAPKLNKDATEVDFIKMLFASMKHPEVSKELSDLFIIKWDEPCIEMEQKQDLLTPLLVVEFLSILKRIVQKGLKKSYYRVTRNLNSRVKGKVLVGANIKHNLLKNKQLYTICTYDEFGLDNKENRLLKKAFVFIKRYLAKYPHISVGLSLQNTFNYISPAFHEVSEEIELNEIKHSKTNAFYKEYEPALKLAKLILRRFGYNISNTVNTKIQTPPFWIDMPKMFELYVLGLLKDRFNKEVKFQFGNRANHLDFILNSDSFKMVIDAKYKPTYIDGVVTDDVRQVSGYARMEKVYKELKRERGEVIDCLIIYPDLENGLDKFSEDVDFKSNEIADYYDIYKIGVKLPLIDKRV